MNSVRPRVFLPLEVDGAGDVVPGEGVGVADVDEKPLALAVQFARLRDVNLVDAAHR